MLVDCLAIVRQAMSWQTFSVVHAVQKYPAEIPRGHTIIVYRRVNSFDKIRPPIRTPNHTTVYHKLHSLPNDLGIIAWIFLVEPLKRYVVLMSSSNTKPSGIEDVVIVYLGKYIRQPSLSFKIIAYSRVVQYSYFVTYYEQAQHSDALRPQFCLFAWNRPRRIASTQLVSPLSIAIYLDNLGKQLLTIPFNHSPLTQAEGGIEPIVPEFDVLSQIPASHRSADEQERSRDKISPVS